MDNVLGYYVFAVSIGSWLDDPAMHTFQKPFRNAFEYASFEDAERARLDCERNNSDETFYVFACTALAAAEGQS